VIRRSMKALSPNSCQEGGGGVFPKILSGPCLEIQESFRCLGLYARERAVEQFVSVRHERDAHGLVGSVEARVSEKVRADELAKGVLKIEARAF